MVSINYAFKEICCKIVYYGPGLSGKTSNLQYVHQKIPLQTRGELISLATDQDRTLYFDFLPVNIGKIHGFSVKFQLYTVPGQVYYNATRKLVLRGVDGLVFVADSQRSKMEENIESYQNLVENLEEYGYDLKKLPLVFQYNKRDLSEISPVEEMEHILNTQGLPHFEAVATQGRGVFDTLKCISKLVLELAKGERVVPEREVSAEEVRVNESPPPQPEEVMALEDSKMPTAVSPFPETMDYLSKKETEAMDQGKLSPVLGEWSGSTSPYPSPSPEISESLPAQREPEQETLPPREKEALEKEKEEGFSEGFLYGREEKKVEDESPPPKSGETPTIISWSAVRAKRKSEPKGFFLWRVFNKLINR
jgi:signal recognition particle receptor subunit beta